MYHMFTIKNKLLGIGAAGLITAMSLTGCGTTTTTSTSPTTTVPSTTNSNKPQNNVVVKNPNGTESVIVGGSTYKGAAKLKHFESLAQSQPTNEQAQINAALSANVNSHPHLAISYYEKAIKIAPTDAIPYNNIGNIYLRTLGQPQKALPYYQKATQVNPTYAYGWWNLALCQGQLKNITAEKQTLQQALKTIPKSDPLYSTIKQLQTSVLKAK
ncbi:hypothetical protein MM817_01726 [Acidibacillus sp. S0AB]|uniref:TPR repeat-containing protein n=2 Tax=Sulfoacidibacillus ferrooxidans TaxID=2005001 RepID=A0A9X1V8Z0_9BACL|nr:hypothetical protein [Sulfoacidibacillus ferrooxidans]